MTLNRMELSYRRTAIEGASPMGLMIALLDTMAGDFRRASAAIRRNDIEARCKEFNHAALVIGQLESWLDLEKGGESAQTLARFYALLRAKMMEASVKQSAEVLDAQIETILHVRSAWQQFDAMPAPAQERPANAQAGHMNSRYAPAFGEMTERIPFSQSA
jgi:flagellar protein FliS